jgi:hypothetical protein
MRKLVIVVVVSAVLSAALVHRVNGQDQRTPQPAAATMEQVLAELRALRVEMSQASNASVRAQLLVARVALQEQRINVVGRELADVQEKLEANERARPMANMWKSMNPPEDAAPRQETGEQHKFLDALRGQADLLEKADRELKERQAELSRVLADEQSRWTSFNAQLDALERALSAR